MKLCVLGSGSKGHSVYVEAGRTRVLFDAGFSGRETKRRLHLIGVDLSDITAIVISHEHTDHVAGLRALGRHFPVYATQGTLAALCFRFSLNGTEVISAGEWVELAALRVCPVPLSHDAREPVGFIIEDGSCRAAIITDLGVVTNAVRHHVSDASIAVIESNHDASMLRDGPYPWDLKQRIKSRMGHLSNVQAANLLTAMAHPGLARVFMAHLSEVNNLPELARGEAELALDGRGSRVDVCFQDRPAEMVRA